MGQHHHLYNSAWRKARGAYLSANPLCRMHLQLGQVVAASVVDHIKPHAGDLSLFWNRANWQPLCKPCHDAHKQAQEATGLLRGAGVGGAPLDLSHPWHRDVIARGVIKTSPSDPARPVPYNSAQDREMDGGGLS